MAGVRPKEPGFKTVTIEPHLGALKYVVAGIPHPEGMIETEYTVNHSGVATRITLPAGVLGELRWKGKVSTLHEGTQTIHLP